MTSPVLVTGATGKTGRRVVAQLVARGVPVRAGVRGGSAPDGAEPVRFEWRNVHTYRPALAGIRGLYLVLPPFVVDPTGYVGTLLRVAAAAGVRRIVLLTALGVDRGDATAPMRRVEWMVEESSIPNTILRPAPLMENFSEPHWDGARLAIAERDEFVLPGGSARVGYVSADDVATVAAAALTEDGHAGKGYSLTGPEALTPPEIAQVISRAVGRPVHHAEADPDGVRSLLRAAGAPEDYAHHQATGGLTVLTGEVTSVTGRQPTSFAAFARAAAERGAWRAVSTSSAGRGDAE
ncbi:NAD(P)H-binding protein [Cryptosporangium aurantiacum]|uniref:Uncharacterized conserved protein YbjT, contains NAD(P)-binding and DUF2867 domains n=1 Tax=Cryptosporangium aurantiacum TaxID=134849 RepID=A0A1M7RPD5_9ACTN|nr:NAD(P)H-binding protein [Cryptosporangium aurantiacum]SHN48089.1 Uncharacterized conserved protein YbjT, contains NAD(P)-binding and DUF2867 domains [Cryptosporangium aurantiacum]